MTPEQPSPPLMRLPDAVLAVQPTVELAKRFSRQRIDPLLEETPALRERVAPARARDSGNTMLSKEFPGGILVLTGSANAVNLTDGLDGLATGCIASAAIAYAVITYAVGRIDWSHYLLVQHVAGAGEMTVISGLVGTSA